MSDAVIKVEDLGKMYRIRHEQRERYTALRDVIARKLKGLGRRSTGQQAGTEEFWALRDLAFEVKQGETLGIIGRNGAGKSTLLKVLSRITAPTTGRIRLRGRLGSLLEVGTGFHPELTGRENIFLNGAILGMANSEIRRKFDEIVAFAEVERFLDTPVKRYSSGMYVRLAFAVAAHMEPDILVVDEVLAVGDIEFQKKCLGRMEKAASTEGRTVLFVSHNLVALRSLCSRALWLEGGRPKLDGPADHVVSRFIAGITRSANERTWRSDDVTAPGNERVRLQLVAARASDHVGADALLTVADSFDLVFEYELLGDGQEIHLAVFLWNDQGVPVFVTFPDPSRTSLARDAGLWRSAFTVPAHLLNDGTYRVQITFVAQRTHALSVHDEVLVFEVHDRRPEGLGWHGVWPGAVRPELDWSTHKIQAPITVASDSLVRPVAAG